MEYIKIKVYSCLNSNIFSNIELDIGDYKCIVYRYSQGAIYGNPSEYYISFGNRFTDYRGTYTETLKGDYEWNVTLTPRTDENEKCYITFETTQKLYYQLVLIKLDNGHG